MLSLLEKLAAIEAIGLLGVDLSWLNRNYQRALFHYVRKCSADRLREVAQPHRHAALVCFLWQSYHDAADQAIDMFDKLVTRIRTKAQQDLDDQMCEQRRTIKTSLAMLRSLGKIILDDTVCDAEMRERIFAEVPKDELASRIEGISEWVSGKKSDLFHGVVRRFGYLRRFSPVFLQALEFHSEAQRAALAVLVHAITRLDTSLSWGEGRTSASDGQRFSLPRRVLQQTYSTKFSDFALEFYSFVADNYAPFYSTPIECTDRDAAFVLDGLLYNESELELEEHYTDTHGYTEINFAAFAMLGRRFCPRIRGLQHQRIYRIYPDRDYGPLVGLVGRADRTIDTGIIAEQWDRMGQFYASLESGQTTASVALKRLASYSGKNRFYRANRDLGRILKTEFILSYMSEPQLRARIRRGLLKVEQLHALARDVYYGRRGRINARELHEQMNSCSCLTLTLACIIYWQAREISRALRSCDPEENGIDTSFLEHISPIEWDNVILYGEYVIDRSLIC